MITSLWIIGIALLIAGVVMAIKKYVPAFQEDTNKETREEIAKKNVSELIVTEEIKEEDIKKTDSEVTEDDQSHK